MSTKEMMDKERKSDGLIPVLR